MNFHSLSGTSHGTKTLPKNWMIYRCSYSRTSYITGTSQHNRHLPAISACWNTTKTRQRKRRLVMINLIKKESLVTVATRKLLLPYGTVISITENILKQANQLPKEHCKTALAHQEAFSCFLLFQVKINLAFKDLMAKQILTYSMSYHPNLEMGVWALSLCLPHFWGNSVICISAKTIGKPPMTEIW